jgi:predicted ATPase
MINLVIFHNFKAFSDLSIPTKALTLLSGLNGTGKSTVLQAIAMLRQSYNASFLQQGGWLLNGELVELGTGKDVAFEDGDDVISIALQGVGRQEIGTITQVSAVERKPDADVLWPINSNLADPGKWNALAPFKDDFQYLRADRIVPAVTFPKSQHAVQTRKFLGVRGEFAAHYLLEYGDDDIPSSSLAHQNDPSRKLLSQTNAWMQEFSPGVRIDVQSVPMTDLVRLEFSYRTRGAAYGASFRPTNVGFGLTHALPVVVACLAAPPGSMVLIENPEAQLHPQGQVAIGQLLAKLAATGVQVIVESHSDHVLNGIRLAVKRKMLAPDNVGFHFFMRNDTARTTMRSPAIDENGLFSEWPDGFFTQWDDTLLELLK